MLYVSSERIWFFWWSVWTACRVMFNTWEMNYSSGSSYWYVHHIVLKPLILLKKSLILKCHMSFLLAWLHMARRDWIIKLSPIGKTIYGSTKRILLLCCAFALLSARKMGQLSNIALIAEYYLVSRNKSYGTSSLFRPLIYFLQNTTNGK